MRHRASRPLIDLWRRLPRATARPLGAVAGLGPARALVAFLLMLGLGTGVVVAVASDVGGSSDRPSESQALGPRPGPATSRNSERPKLTDERHTPASRTPSESSRTSAAPSQGRSAQTSTESVTPSTGSIAPTVRSKLRQATRSPSIATPSPSTSTSHQGGAAPRDRTAPNTSLSQQFPEADAAVFSFSATEPASFSCSLDGAAFTSCGSPRSYSGLDSGWHTFAVRATDTAGNVDASPATTRWHATGAPSTDR